MVLSCTVSEKLWNKDSVPVHVRRSYRAAGGRSFYRILKMVLLLPGEMEGRAVGRISVYYKHPRRSKCDKYSKTRKRIVKSEINHLEAVKAPLILQEVGRPRGTANTFGLACLDLSPCSIKLSTRKTTSATFKSI